MESAPQLSIDIQLDKNNLKTLVEIQIWSFRWNTFNNIIKHMHANGIHRNSNN